MRDKILNIVAKHCIGRNNCEILTQELFDLYIVSKPFATATETTDNIVKGRKYEIVDEELMGYYIIDESGDSTYYHHSALNVC